MLASPSVESKGSQYWGEKRSEERHRDSGLSQPVHVQSSIPSSVLAARPRHERHDSSLPSPGLPSTVRIKGHSGQFVYTDLVSGITQGSPKLHFSYIPNSTSNSTSAVAGRNDILRLNGNDAHRRHTLPELPPIAPPPSHPPRSHSLQVHPQSSRSHHEPTHHNSTSRAINYSQPGASSSRISRPASREEGVVLSPISPSRSYPPPHPLPTSRPRDWSPPPPTRRSSGSYAPSPHPTGSGVTPQSPIVVESEQRGSADTKHTHSRPGSSGSANQVSLAPHLLGQHAQPPQQQQPHRTDGIAMGTPPQMHPTSSPRGIHPSPSGNQTTVIYTYPQPLPSPHTLSPNVSTIQRQPMPPHPHPHQHSLPRENVQMIAHNQAQQVPQQRRQTYPQQTASPSSSARVPAHPAQHPYPPNHPQARSGPHTRYPMPNAPVSDPGYFPHTTNPLVTSNSPLTYLQSALAQAWGHVEHSWLAEAEELRRNIAERDKDIRNANAVIEDREKEINRLKARPPESVPASNERDAHTISGETRIRALEEQLAKSERERMKSESEKTHLKGELISLRSDKEELMEEVEELQNQVRTARPAGGEDGESKRLTEEIKILKAELDSWKNEANGLRLELDRRDRKMQKDAEAQKAATMSQNSRPNGSIHSVKDVERPSHMYDPQQAHRIHNGIAPVSRHPHSLKIPASLQPPASPSVMTPISKIDTNITERARVIPISPQEEIVQRSQHAHHSSSGGEYKRSEHSLAPLPSIRHHASPNVNQPISLPPIMSSLPNPDVEHRASPVSHRPHLPHPSSHSNPVEPRPSSSLSHRQSNVAGPENVNGLLESSSNISQSVRSSTASEAVNGRKRDREEDSGIVGEEQSSAEAHGHGGKVMRRENSEDVVASREKEREREVNGRRMSDTNTGPAPTSSSSWSSTTSTVAPNASPPNTWKPPPPPPPGSYAAQPKPGILLTSKPPSPPSSVPVPPAKKREEKPRQLSFKHLNLLYESSNETYICRECRQASSGRKPKTFPISTALPEMFKHSWSEHESRCEELLKASASKLAEEGVLMRGGGGSTLGTGGKAPRRERK
ncbi:hypothetical protein VNI00_001879 [Paramarasmius palmivorus]|uniref:Uncharacterized protein n=1 Tax=Paramarasmius palmivorus TaxID=297713 RepID=A0AAW0E5Y3_9AGAR